MSWLALALLAPLVWAFTNVIDKYALSKLVKDPFIPAFAFSISGVVAGVLILSVHGFVFNTPLVLLAAFAGGILIIGAEFLYFKATQIEEISRVISLVYLDPLFTAVLAAFVLGEVFTPVKYIGVVLLVAGAVTISHKRGEGFGIRAAVRLCIASAFLFAVCNIINKFLLPHSDFWTIFVMFRFGSFAVMAPFAYFKRAVIREFLLSGALGVSLVFFNSVLTVLGNFLFAAALPLGAVTLTTALGALQPFFVLVLTTLVGFFYPQILKEEGGKIVFAQKLFAIALMFIGVVLINP